MAWTEKRKQRAVEAANWFISAAEKRTLRQLAKHFSMTRRQAFRLIQDVRRVTRDSPYNLTCSPSAPRKPWLYWITAVREEDGQRRRFSLGHVLTRFGTELDMNESFVAASKGTTREGKVARAFKAHIAAAVAELEIVD